MSLLYPRSGDRADAIDHYCRELAGAFIELGWSAHRSASLDTEAARSDLLAVQYNPFGYGRWGFAPSLPAALMGLRRSPRRPVVALMVHEAFVPIVDARTLVMGGWQRAQLRAVTAGVDVVFHAVEDRMRLLDHRWPRRPSEYLPVGANVPDGRPERESVRAAHGWGAEALVVATLGGSHPSKLNAWVAPALEAIAGMGRPTVHAALGSHPLETGVAGIGRLAPGFLDAGSLAAHLAAADLLLAPYVDGVSGRRGSVMAALRNGLAVVSTSDRRSDSLLTSPASGITLVPTHDAEGFARAARELAARDAHRRACARAGLRLYEERFDWPVIARRLAQARRASVPGAA